MAEIHIKSGLSDFESIVGILVKNGYVVNTEAKMRKFPEEKTIDYFRVNIAKKAGCSD